MPETNSETKSETKSETNRGGEVIGEVVEASTTRFVAQCLPERLHEPPALGAFVKILPPGAQRPAAKPLADAPLIAGEDYDPFADPVPIPAFDLTAHAPDGTCYALVASATTGSAEPGRRAAAYGLSEDDLRLQQPQIFDLLATEFVALPIGYAESGRAVIGLASRPPRLHAQVGPCDAPEIIALTEQPDFVRRVLQAACETPVDELLTATLRAAFHARRDDFAYLVRAGKQIALLLRDDPERCAALLRKLQPH